MAHYRNGLIRYGSAQGREEKRPHTHSANVLVSHGLGYRVKTNEKRLYKWSMDRRANYDATQ